MGETRSHAFERNNISSREAQKLAKKGPFFRGEQHKKKGPRGWAKQRCVVKFLYEKRKKGPFLKKRSHRRGLKTGGKTGDKREILGGKPGLFFERSMYVEDVRRL